MRSKHLFLWIALSTCMGLSSCGAQHYIYKQKPPLALPEAAHSCSVGFGSVTNKDLAASYHHGGDGEVFQNQLNNAVGNSLHNVHVGEMEKEKLHDQMEKDYVMCLQGRHPLAGA